MSIPLHFEPGDVADWNGERVKVKQVLPHTKLVLLWHADGRPGICKLDELELPALPKAAK